MKGSFRNIITLFVSVFLAGSVNATLLSYEITQGGWSGGGTIYGLFTGDDSNNDGYLDFSSNEIYSYDINFTGNLIIGDFSHNLSDLMYFRYTIGSGGFRPSYPLYSNDGSIFYDADDYVIAQTDFSTWVTTSENAVVTAVPSPSSLSLIMIGLVAVFIKKRI